MLLRECEQGGVTRWQPCAVQGVRKAADGFEVDTDRGPVRTKRVVVATGGLPGPEDRRHRLRPEARPRVRPAHHRHPPRPRAAHLRRGADWAPFVPLAGLSLPVQHHQRRRRVPGRPALHAPRPERPGRAADLELLAGRHAHHHRPRPAASTWRACCKAAKGSSRRKVANELPQHLPARLAEAWLSGRPLAERPIADTT